MRLTADGQLDPEFGDGGIVTLPELGRAAPTGLGFDDRGRILVGGLVDTRWSVLVLQP